MGDVIAFRPRRVERVGCDWPLAVLFNVFVLVLVVGAVLMGLRVIR